MKITTEWLEEERACKEGIEFFQSQSKTDPIKLIKKYKNTHWDWCNWLIVRLMTYKQCVSYSIFAAEQVLHLYEKQYPSDNRPRKAIEAAKKCISDSSVESKQNAACATAYASAYSAYSARSATYAACVSAVAYIATDDASYSADVAYAADMAAAYAADAANTSKIKQQILTYGLRLLK